MGEESKKGFHCIYIRELKRVTKGITGVKNTILKEWIKVVKQGQDLQKQRLLRMKQSERIFQDFGPN